MPERKAVIIGAGPAGLTAAFELLDKTDIRPVVLEASDEIGGIARTVKYKGNRIDIGGHRFFSKSDRVMDWWRQFLPLQGAPARDQKTLDIRYQGKERSVTVSEDGPDPEKVDRVMLVRNRLSRIFFLRRFFSYPLALNGQTLGNLGPVRLARIGASLIATRLRPIKNEKSLEDFFINRFGRELYLTFFKDYTEKVWGVPCHEISAEWGAQRIKGLSLTKAIKHAIGSLKPKKASGDISQKGTETSLIERFLYPKHGPGQLWEYVADLVQNKGGAVRMREEVVKIHHEPGRIVAVETRNADGATTRHEGDYFFSSMPVKDLINAMGDTVPANVKQVANGLVYRDFITVGLLLRELKVKHRAHEGNGDANTLNSDLIPDNWIYIQERDVKIGRLQVFNNWSPYLVADPKTVWLGLEYFCNEGDELWSRSDEEFKRFAVEELSRIDIITPDAVLDAVVIRVPKTYPAYFGSYDRFKVIRDYVDTFSNLFLVGRNGMHRYNNQDHSMLTAMVAVENIRDGLSRKDNIWEVNTEMEYHEEKK